MKFATIISLSAVAAAVIFGLSTASAADGDLIFEYTTEQGTMPHDQAWSIEAQTLRQAGPDPDDCPLKGLDWANWEFQCYWFGGVDGNSNGYPDNDGSTMPINASGGGYLDGIRSPIAGTDFNRLSYPGSSFDGYLINYVHAGDTTYKDTETYSEWIEFDDGADDLVHVATLATYLPDYIRKTPRGAQNFPGSPAHQTLRLVGGDGNGVAASLPGVASFNNQDGQVLIRKSYEPNGITGTVTVVWRGALSYTHEGEANHAFLLVRAYDPTSDTTVYFAFTANVPRTMSGGVPVCVADDPNTTDIDESENSSGDCGRLGVTNLQQSMPDSPLLDGHAGGPDLGNIKPQEFFTFRAICDPANGGTAQIWVNEEEIDRTDGIVTNATFGTDFNWGIKGGGSTGDDRRMVKFGLRHEDDTTMWIDYVKVYEGGVVGPPPNPCKDYEPVVFDTTGPSLVSDGYVNEQDFGNFVACVTGPAAGEGILAAMDPMCGCMDRNSDNSVDQEDFAYFQLCYTGSVDTLDPDCDGVKPIIED